MKYSFGIISFLYLTLLSNLVYAPLDLEDQVSQHFIESSSADVLSQMLLYNHEPRWPSQWYINEEVTMMGDEIIAPTMKIAHMHFMDIKGNDVAFVIVGNSVPNYSHADFDSRFQWNRKNLCLDGRTYDYMFPSKYKRPEGDLIASTVAGIIGMQDQNDICAVGIAPRSILGSIVINLRGGSGSPEYLIQSVTEKNREKLIIFVHVWNDHELIPIGKLVHIYDSKNYLDIFVTKGVKPQVMGSGDFGSIGNTCQCNQYATLNSMFVFGSVTYDGFLAEYSETGATIIGVTFSTSYGNQYYNKVVTIDNINLLTCRDAPQDTTIVSAAIGGGILGLLMEHFKKTHYVEPTITDIIFLLASCSDTEYLRNKNILWLQNAAGLSYSFEGGFGLPNMFKIYHKILSWKPMPLAKKFTAYYHEDELKWNCRNYVRKHKKWYQINWRKKLAFTPTQGIECTFEISNKFYGFFVETFGLRFNAWCPRRGSITIYLISPKGTVSCILEGRPSDSTDKNYTDMFVKTFHFLGEPLAGTWTLRVFTEKNPEEFFNLQQQSSSYERKTKECTIYKIFVQATVVQNLPSSLYQKNIYKKDIETISDFVKLKEWVDFRYFTYLQVNFQNHAQKREAYKQLIYFLQKNNNMKVNNYPKI